MYSSEDLERFYVDYQSEWVPRGMTLQAYCSRNNVPYKVMENFSRNIQKKIVEVQVTGRPSEDVQMEGFSSNLMSSGNTEQKRAADNQNSQPRQSDCRISVLVRFGDGTEVSRRGLDYMGLKVLIEKLEVLC